LDIFLFRVCVFCSHALPWKVDRVVWRYDEGWLSYSGTYWRLDWGVWRYIQDGRAVLEQIEGLADVFEGIGWEAELFWDLSKAWPTCLKGLDERSSCFETYGGLGRWVWRGWMRSRCVLGLMEGLADVFEGVGWEADVLRDLWRPWLTCLKGLDGRSSFSGTYQRLRRRVWRDWMRSQAVLRLMKGLADKFEGFGWEPDVLWDLWRAWPTCLKGWMGGRRVIGLMEGLADVFEEVWWEAELFWDLSKAWTTCLKGLDERPSCFKTYGGLGRRVWRGWMRASRVLGLMEGFADVFERVGWEANVL